MTKRQQDSAQQVACDLGRLANGEESAKISASIIFITYRRNIQSLGCPKRPHEKSGYRGANAHHDKDSMRRTRLVYYVNNIFALGYVDSQSCVESDKETGSHEYLFNVEEEDQVVGDEAAETEGGIHNKQGKRAQISIGLVQLADHVLG